jgi:outer membrane protein
MNKKYITILFLLSFLSSVHAQEQGSSEKVFTLQDVVDLAKGQSPASKLASTNFTTKYWQYKVYKSNYLPQLSLNSVIPNLNRSISPITQPDGTTLFIRQSLISTSADVSLTQNIGYTNSQIFVSSQVQPHHQVLIMW